MQSKESYIFNESFLQFRKYVVTGKPKSMESVLKYKDISMNTRVLLAECLDYTTKSISAFYGKYIILAENSCAYINMPNVLGTIVVTDA